MSNRLSGPTLQKRIYSEKLNFETETHFGKLVGSYLIRRFRKDIKLPLLDAGSADGSILRHLRKTFPDNTKDLVGLDLIGVSELNVVSGDLTRMPFDGDRFKTIICTEVLEHLEGPILERALNEFKRVLRPSGRLLCTFPYREDLSKLTFRCPHCDGSFHKYGHVRSWESEKEVRSMFSQNGFAINTLDVLPLGAVAMIPPLRLLKFALNRFNNPSGFRKRVIVLASGA